MANYSVADIAVLHTPSCAPTLPQANYDGIYEEAIVLPSGHRRTPQNRAFDVATIWERDVAFKTREGLILRADVFRPEFTTAQIPALVAWSPYGKSGTGSLDLTVVPGRAGIPIGMVSGFQSFEAFDPAEWVKYDYAVVNVDAQGILSSEGHHKWHGSAEGRDGYDIVEAIAALPWCNGRVALMGNSWLASAQWFIASMRPPHLTCILPLEGLSDVYRESLCRGGVPYLPFWTFLGYNLFGHKPREDTIAMIKQHPLMNGYWADKRAQAHLIDIPAYILASMSTSLHTVGSIRCFEDIPHQKKWLRMNATQEWHDLYQRETVDDLKMFLDFYTKDVPNGWEQTPQVRISVLRYNKPAITNVPFTSWPIPATVHQELYLSQGSSLVTTPVPTVGSQTYQSDVPALQTDADSGFTAFTHTFASLTTLIGPSRAVLYMSCEEHDDMDVFVILRKLNAAGEVLRNINIPVQDLVDIHSDVQVPLINTMQYIGPSGVLRASHRRLDPELTKPHWPAHDHSVEEKVPPGSIVKLEIGLWPAAIQFEAGESLSLRIAGHSMVLAEFEPLRGAFQTGNVGKHVVHFGGDYESKLILALVDI
ncbi:hypothetical protein PV08_11667 [Exophiala spinifera]|uniref:Xaa-Pro dipeptidyl-peptidase C-terminal domain-containing protein n=1 Tax=Exophiala spinifera TaxID=91928 RepID=A0A0D2AVE7_9EURO|nr:uncharacterized protein PV08_11667 [Exophiala spinifera]KIW10703.1 hypothetical protein PV08_11667 [Exophiala spinifera]